MKIRLALLGFMLVAIVSSGWAGGAKETDTKLVMENGEVYISPNSDFPDHLTLKITDIKLQIDPKGVIKQYRFVVTDRSGKTVYEHAESNLKDRGFFGEALGVGDIPKVTLPTSIEWNGLDNAGKQVPDGEYLYQLSTLDSFGKIAVAAPLPVIFDTKSPTVNSLTLSTGILSPDGDGKKDSLTVSHLSVAAYKWQLQVLDAESKPVFDKTWQAEGSSERDDIQLPPKTEWNPAQAAAGSPDALKEGSYTVQVQGWDRAGNKTTATQVFKVSYTDGGLSLTVAGNAKGFNPTAGVKLLASLSEKAGAETWKLEVSDKDGAVWRRIEGKGAVPESFDYFGTGQAGLPWSDSGRLPDGRYQFTLEQSYQNGTVLQDGPLVLDFDATAPLAQLKLSVPNLAMGAQSIPWFGGAAHPQILIEAKAEAGVDWTVELRRNDTSQEPSSFAIPLADLLSARDGLATGTWDGSLPEGQGTLPDGTWSMLILGKDSSGNSGQSNKVEFAFLTKNPEIRGVSADKDSLLLKNGDAPEQVSFSVDVSAPEAVAFYTVQVSDAAGAPIFGQHFLPTNPLVWHGERTNGLFAPEGSYSVTIAVSLLNGDQLSTEALPVQLRLDAGATLAGSTKYILPRLLSTAPALLEAGEKAGTPFTIQVAGLEGASIPWSLQVKNLKGAVLWKQDGTGTDKATATWTSPYTLLGEEYTATLSLAGPDNTQLELSKSLLSAIPVEQEGKRLRVLVPSILFEGNETSALSTATQGQSGNTDLLQRLGRKLSELRGYRIVIEGHATFVNGKDPAAMKLEQQDELVPLSRERALDVKKILFMLGVDWNAMEVVALGGEDPVVPHTDQSERWQNRRVAIYLVPTN